MESWHDYVTSMSAGLRDVAVTGNGGAPLTPSDGFERWVAMTHAAHMGGQSVFLIGNGASAALASHFAADACKNGGLRARAFDDPSLLAATGNDETFGQVFALPLARFGQPGDVLISISSSGRSPNILRALEQARAMQLRIVTLSGRGSDNPSRSFGDVSFYVPCDRYGWIESAHQVILHYWLDRYLNVHGRGAV